MARSAGPSPGIDLEAQPLAILSPESASGTSHDDLRRLS
jgi:hypothetical protein